MSNDTTAAKDPSDGTPKSTNDATKRTTPSDVKRTTGARPKGPARAATPSTDSTSSSRRPATSGRGDSATSRPLGQPPRTGTPGHKGEHKVKSLHQYQEEVVGPEFARTGRRLEDIERLLRVLSAKEIQNAAWRAELKKFRFEFALMKRDLQRIIDDPNAGDPIVDEVNDEKKRSLEGRMSSFYRTLDDRITGLEDRIDREVAPAVDELNVQLGAHKDTINSHTTQLGHHETMLLKHHAVYESVEKPSKIPLIAGLIVGVIAFLLKATVFQIPDLVTETGNRTTVVALSLYNGFWGSLLVGIMFGCIAYLIAYAFTNRRHSSDSGDNQVRENHQSKAADSFVDRRTAAKESEAPSMSTNADTKTVTVDVKPDETVTITNHDDVAEVDRMFADDPDAARRSTQPVHN